MVDYKQFEEQCFEYLKTQFDKVLWLSKNSSSAIDFQCIKNNITYKIEAKYTEQKKIRLLPSQKDVDAVIINNQDEVEILWKKDFCDRIVYEKMQLIKLSETNKIWLDSLKLTKRETYNDVFDRLFKRI